MPACHDRTPPAGRRARARTELYRLGVAVALGAAAVVATTGCGDNDRVARVRALAERACACAELACAQAVDAELREALRDAASASKSEAEAMQAALVRAGTCSRRLTSAATP